MSFVFELPDLGEGLPDATIVKWLVKEGDTVKVDQPIAEMETAKAVVEVPSPVNGVILKLHGNAGDVIITHAPLVTFGNAGEKPAAAPAPSASAPMHAQVAANLPAASSSGGGEVFLLPDLGEGLPDATIVKWLVKEGDTVKVDQPIAEMETAKAVVEVPSPHNGVIAKLHGKAGDVIITHAPLVTFAGAGAAVAPASAAPTKQDQAPADAGTVVGSVQVGNTIVAETSDAVVKALAKKLGVDLTQVTGTGSGGKITQADVKTAAAGTTPVGAASAAMIAPSGTHIAAKAAPTQTNNPLAFRASPAVRKLANELGVDLSRCNTSGPKGTITRDDVKAASSGAPAIAAKAAPTTAVAAPVAGARLPTVTVQIKPEPVRGVRRAMAQAMTLSHQTVVPVTLMEDANISKWKKGEDSLARYIRALCVAAKVEPALNAWFDGVNMERLLHPNVNVGIAVDTPDGLYVPVVSEAQAKSNAELRADVETLRKKIADKAIKPTDLTGATITLSNYGSIAGRYGTPIVTPPQVAILGCGRFRNELKTTERGIENQRMLPLSLSFDHRACTGGEGARFLAAVMADLEKPE